MQNTASVHAVMSGTEERRKSARQRRVRPTAHSSALESLRAARDGLESRAEQQEVREELLKFHSQQCLFSPLIWYVLHTQLLRDWKEYR